MEAESFCRRAVRCYTTDSRSLMSCVAQSRGMRGYFAICAYKGGNNDVVFGKGSVS